MDWQVTAMAMIAAVPPQVHGEVEWMDMQKCSFGMFATLCHGV